MLFILDTVIAIIICNPLLSIMLMYIWMIIKKFISNMDILSWKCYMLDSTMKIFVAPQGNISLLDITAKILVVP